MPLVTEAAERPRLVASAAGTHLLNSFNFFHRLGPVFSSCCWAWGSSIWVSVSPPPFPCGAFGLHLPLGSTGTLVSSSPICKNHVQSARFSPCWGRSPQAVFAGLRVQEFFHPYEVLLSSWRRSPSTLASSTLALVAPLRRRIEGIEAGLTNLF